LAEGIWILALIVDFERETVQHRTSKTSTEALKFVWKS